MVSSISNLFSEDNMHQVEVHWQGHPDSTLEPIDEFVSTKDINVAFIEYLRSKTAAPLIQLTKGRIKKFKVENTRLQFQLGRSKTWVDGVVLINERPNEVATFFNEWINNDPSQGSVEPREAQYVQPSNHPAQDAAPPVARNNFTRLFHDLEILPTKEQDLVEHVLPILAKLHVSSRPLLRLPVVEKMTITQQQAIREVLLDWSAEVEPELNFCENNSNASQLRFTNLYIRWCALPVERIIPKTSLQSNIQQTAVLVNGYPNFDLIVGNAPPRPQPQRPTASATAMAAQDMEITPLEHKKISAAIKATKAGRSAGSKVLHSHGISPPTEATRQVISSSFPRYTDQHSPSIIATDPNSCYDLSYKTFLKDIKASATGNKSFDVYGMSPDFLKLVKDTKSDPRPNPLAQLARMMAHMQKAHLISDVVAFVASAGSIIPMNKISAEENQLRIDKGADPKVRPINQGHGLFATICKTLNSTADAKKVRKGMMNIQYADKKHGIPKLVAATRGAYNSGYAISKSDMINAFNAAEAQKMADAIGARWNRLHSFHDRFFSNAIGKPVFMSGWKDGLPAVFVFLQYEGAKQGNALGSTTFNLTMGYHVYDPLQASFPDVPLAAATDDLIRLFKTPNEDASLEDWRSFLTFVSEHMSKFDELIGNIKLRRHPDKDIILLPPHAKLPPEAIQDPATPGSYTFPCPNGITLHISTAGIEICKSPIGTDDYVQSHTIAKAMELNRRTNLVGKLGKVDPQIGLNMLRRSANVGFDHYSSVTPALNTTATDSFDLSILSAVATTLDIKPIGPYQIHPDR